MHISWFRDISLADRPTVGGKGGSLGELQRAGIDVPPGFVVRTSAFEDFIAELERQDPVRSRVAALAADDLEVMGAASLPSSVVADERIATTGVCPVSVSAW